MRACRPLTPLPPTGGSSLLLQQTVAIMRAVAVPKDKRRRGRDKPVCPAPAGVAASIGIDRLREQLDLAGGRSRLAMCPSARFLSG